MSVHEYIYNIAVLETEGLLYTNIHKIVILKSFKSWLMKRQYIEFLLHLFACVHEHIYLSPDAHMEKSVFFFHCTGPGMKFSSSVLAFIYWTSLCSLLKYFNPYLKNLSHIFFKQFYREVVASKINMLVKFSKWYLTNF